MADVCGGFRLLPGHFSTGGTATGDRRCAVAIRREARHLPACIGEGRRDSGRGCEPTAQRAQQSAAVSARVRCRGTTERPALSRPPTTHRRHGSKSRLDRTLAEGWWGSVDRALEGTRVGCLATWVRAVVTVRGPTPTAACAPGCPHTAPLSPRGARTASPSLVLPPRSALRAVAFPLEVQANEPLFSSYTARPIPRRTPSPKGDARGPRSPRPVSSPSDTPVYPWAVPRRGNKSDKTMAAVMATTITASDH